MEYSIFIEKYTKNKYPHNMLELFLKDNFGNINLNLIEGKTVVFYILNNNEIISSVCTINDLDLINYLTGINPDYLNLYSIKAKIGAHIYNLATNKNYREKGLGKKIIGITLYSLKQMNYEYCHTHVEENNHSKKIFMNKGFHITNKIPINPLLSNGETLLDLNFWID